MKFDVKLTDAWHKMLLLASDIKSRGEEKYGYCKIDLLLRSY